MFTAQQQFEIGLMLERLSIAHGWRKLNEHEQMFFIEQMEGWHRSADDIVKAIKSLYDVPMSAINLPRIREALAAIMPDNALPDGNDGPLTEDEARRFHEAIERIKIKAMNFKRIG